MPTLLPGRQPEDRNARGKPPARHREVTIRLLRLALYFAILVTALAALVSLFREQGPDSSRITPPTVAPRIAP